MIWNVVESVNPWYEKPTPTPPFWLWIYNENHTKLYKFGMRKLRRKRLPRKFIKTLVERYFGNNMGGADIVQFIYLSCVKKKYKVEI